MHRVHAVARFDVCNGDADGLCSVRQWRLHDPSAARLITGLKRDIALLQQVPCVAASEVLVCDLSVQRNRPALDRLLEGGAQVRWFDHHWSGPVPAHQRLDAHLDFSNEVCTSLLVDRYLGGRFRAWALVGAYGDELTAVADRLALRDQERDDRRMCCECSYLQQPGTCFATQQGWLPNTSTRHAPVTDLLFRCEQFNFVKP